MARTKAKRSKMTIAMSFAIVFGVLSGGTLFVVFSGGPTIEHFPSNVSIPFQPWMTLIPADAVEAACVNLTAVYNIGIHALEFPLIRIFNVGYTLGIQNTTLLATYYLPAPANVPNANSSEIIIFQPTPMVYRTLFNGLNESNLIYRQMYHSIPIFTIYNNITGVKTLQIGEMAFFNGYVIYVQRSQNLMGDIETALNQAINPGPSLFQNSTVIHAVYASLQGANGYLSLQYVGFPVQISGTYGGAKVVYVDGKGFAANYAIGFDSLASAKSSYNFVVSVYHGGFKYYIIDNYVVAQIAYNSTTVLNELETF
jgi:hypothetical protein